MKGFGSAPEDDCSDIYYCGLEVSRGAVLMLEHSSLLLVSGPEFHEEWLRDGPCDATTTGLSNSGSGVNSLPVVGNMRFGVPDLKSGF
jgi:hypothetical protein